MKPSCTFDLKDIRRGALGMCGVYVVRSKDRRKIYYVGQSRNIGKRFAAHLGQGASTVESEIKRAVLASRGHDLDWLVDVYAIGPGALVDFERDMIGQLKPRLNQRGPVWDCPSTATADLCMSIIETFRAARITHRGASLGHDVKIAQEIIGSIKQNAPPIGPLAGGAGR